MPGSAPAARLQPGALREAGTAARAVMLVEAA